MKLIKLLILLIATAIILPALIYMGLYSFNTYKVEKIPIKVTLDDYVGIDVTDEMLNFGTIPPNGRARKNLTIESVYQENVLVKVNIAGDVKGWIIHEDSIILKPNETKELMFIASPPEIAKKGTYNGTAVISFHRIR